MAKNDNLQDFLIDVANAIRSKTGKTDPINPQDFSAEIANLSVSGGSKFDELVDGTITELTRQDLANVDTIRIGAFMLTPLRSVEIPSNVKTIKASAFTLCSLLETLTIDDGVEEIEMGAFSQAPIREIVLPKTISVLRNTVFEDNTALTSITIPSNITTIEADVFKGCANLTEVTMESMTPPSVTSTSFPSNVVSIYVPYSAYDAYVSQWTDYADKIVRLPAIPSTITVIVNNYLNELVNGATVTISGNGQTYTGTTNENGVFTQGDLQPATYTISVADMDGFKTPDSVEVVVEENTQNSAIITYLEKPAIEILPNFSENTPLAISTAGAEIAYKNMTSAEVEARFGWKIGDTTTYTLTTGEKVEMRIIGFNHDDLSDGSGKAGITLDMTHCLATKYPMNSTNTNAGGYAASVMKTYTLPTIKALHHQEWQDVIKPVDKKSANGSGKNYSETLTTSEDLFLFAEIEIFGTTQNAQDGANEGSVYEYWNDKAASADRIKKYDTDGDGVADTATAWWLRSSHSYDGNDNYFCSVSLGGNANSSGASYSRGVAFGFCVGSASDYVPSGGGEDTPTIEFSRTFSENTPEQISAVSAEISANNMTSEQVAETYGWNIGDTISYQLTTGENVEMRIVGFNHDDKSDGSGKAGITLEMTQCLTTKYPMNSSSTNAGGYAASLVKTSTLPAIKGTIPQEWQDVIKLVNKKSANGGSTNYSKTLTLSEDLFLLSQIEVFGTTETLAQDYANEGSVYEYWNGKTSTDRLKKHDSDGDGVPDKIIPWWMRSSYATSDIYFCGINPAGTINSLGPTYNQGVSFAFCV